MKECPVCKESFGDDLSFCDLDGSPLDTGTVQGTASKLWSILGVALLLGAMVITAVVVVFSPRNRTSGNPALTTPSTASGVPAPKPAVSPDQSQPQLAESATKGLADESDADKEATPASTVKAAALNQKTDVPVPSVKAAALAEEGADAANKNAAKAAIDSTGATPKTEPSAKTAREVDPPRSSATADPASAASQDERKRTVKPAADPSSDANANKKDDKKKGGFLKVFKKIFGKN